MKEFAIGDTIEHKQKGTRAEIIDTFALNDVEVGWWVRDEHGACWCLQFDWLKNWQIAKEPKQPKKKSGKSKRKQSS